MELPGAEYLFTLSLVAITFTAVSVLVMLMRHSLGGRPSNFDIYLLTAYISFGFAQTLAGLTPALVMLADLSMNFRWIISSVIAAVLIGCALGQSVYLRSRASPQPMSYSVAGGFAIHAAMIVILLINAVVWRDALFYAAPVTVSLATTMWLFVRRIASLFGDKPGDDWDPKRG
jgi:hypothetical protein